MLRNEEELTEFTKNYLAVEQRERRHMFEEWKEENGYSVQLTGLFPEDVVDFIWEVLGWLHHLCIMDFTIHPKIFRLEPGKVSL